MQQSIPEKKKIRPEQSIGWPLDQGKATENTSSNF
jgi:hypothetical protein